VIEGKTTPQRQVFGIATKVGKGYVAAGGEGVRRNGVERESGGRIFRQRLAELRVSLDDVWTHRVRIILAKSEICSRLTAT